MRKITFKLSNWKHQTILLYIFFSVGIIGHFWSYTYPLMVLLTPYVILISGIWAIYKCYKRTIIILWIIIAYLITFFLEVLGVSLGLIFGPYFYGEVLGPKVFDVPVIIGLNWVFIIFSLALFSEWLVNFSSDKRLNNKIKLVIAAFLTAILATLFDFLMEPVAVGLNYWTWTLTSDPMNVPSQNYVAWFLISFSFGISFLVIPRSKRILLEESPHSPWFVFIQAIFFLAMRILIIL